MERQLAKNFSVTTCLDLGIELFSCGNGGFGGHRVYGFVFALRMYIMSKAKAWF